VDGTADISMTRALVRTMLEHAEDLPWRMQEIGLLGVRLDDRREHRLHVWAPSCSSGEPPVHDHPYDFTSTVVAGEITNTRYEEDAAGLEHVRTRYRIGDEDARRIDSVRLTGAATTFGAGQRYSQRAHELHDSRQLPGTVTVIRCRPVAVNELTVCTVGEAGWMSGQARPATPEEIEELTAAALEWF
jgi:hypothetical protein